MSPSPIRTSRSHPIRVDWLDAPARVGMTLGPGIHGESLEGFRWERDVDEDLAELRRVGATALVCLLEDQELTQYRIEGGAGSGTPPRGHDIQRHSQQHNATTVRRTKYGPPMKTVATSPCRLYLQPAGVRTWQKTSGRPR